MGSYIVIYTHFSNDTVKFHKGERVGVLSLVDEIKPETTNTVADHIEESFAAFYSKRLVEWEVGQNHNLVRVDTNYLHDF